MRKVAEKANIIEGIVMIMIKKEDDNKNNHSILYNLLVESTAARLITGTAHCTCY
jgi:hypothetical protein